MKKLLASLAIFQAEGNPHAFMGVPTVPRLFFLNFI